MTATSVRHRSQITPSEAPHSYLSSSRERHTCRNRGATAGRMFGQTPGNALLDGLGHRGLGLVSGYLGGKFDITGQHLMEILQAFPDLILAMAISMAIGTGMRAVIMATAVARILFGGRVI
jgi:hypothetical protein